MARPISGYAVALLSVATLAGCASTGRVDGGGDILSPEERRLQTVETKLAEMSRRLNGINYTGLDQDNLKLRDELRSLRGEVERLRFDVDSQSKRDKDQYIDLDRRLQRLEGGAAPAAAPSATTVLPTPATPPVAGAPGATAAPPAVAAPVVISNGGGGSPEEESAYLTTFDLLKNGKYDDAIRGFRAMLDKWPQGKYADNATYWMGESYYVKADYKSALNAFQTVLSKFPSSNRAPDAMLKVGLSQIELKQTDQGRATLQRVMQTYPSANAATLAKQRLDALK
ncbi:MAG: tol-pal system protein YbgF [Nevskiaceae bacterium]|nr:MAG: tol-pal system protein YbgF [Nevskiaceae bacterium]